MRSEGLNERVVRVAGHAARGSGREGRSEPSRALDTEAVSLAVVASVRRAETRHDDLLMGGMSRTEARALVRPDIERVLDASRVGTSSETR